MSDDWKVGDLAVFVGEQVAGWFPGQSEAVGNIRRVDGVAEWLGVVGLIFNDLPSPHPTRSWRAAQWRKIRPDEHEPCEDEFVQLLNRSKLPDNTFRVEM